MSAQNLEHIIKSAVSYLAHLNGRISRLCATETLPDNFDFILFNAINNSPVFISAIVKNF
jgi:hypothetical protein